MKLLSLLAVMVIVSVGCSSKKEDCTINGQKVNCSEMEGRREEQPTPQTITVIARGTYEIVNDEFRILSSLVNDEYKVVGKYQYKCSVSLTAGKRFNVRVNEREFVLIQNGQEISFDRLEGRRIDYSNIILGTFENYNSDDRMRLTFNFASRNVLEVKNICYFN